MLTMTSHVRVLKASQCKKTLHVYIRQMIAESPMAAAQNMLHAVILVIHCVALQDLI